MAQFTPSALTVQSMGSMKLTIGHLNEDIISGSDYWTTGITDIRSVMCQPWGGSPIVASTTGHSVSWTASSGTLWHMKDRTMSDSGYIFWILSGGPATLD